MTIEESVIYLASCAVNSEIPNQELVSAMEPEKVIDFAKKHKIVCCIAMALESAGVRNKETTKMITNAMRRNALFENSLEEVTGRLENAGIWYVPLKGIVLKEYYPKPFMREMSDHDILFDASKAQEVKVIMESLGFTTKAFGINLHDIYYKKPVLNFEMHTSLFSPWYDSKTYEYYLDRRDLSKPEDFYLYTVAHEYKHYANSGTGLRSLLDVYLYLKKETLDWDYVEEEAEKIGIKEFEQNNRKLATFLFGKGVVTDERMLSYILSSNAYGTFANKIENAFVKNKGNRILHMLKRFSVPMRKSNPYYQPFANHYPIFYKYRVLLPLLPFYRILLSLKTGKFVTEWKIINSSNEEKKSTNNCNNKKQTP